MPDFHADIPQGIYNFPDQLIRLFRHPVLKQDQQVHVRMKTLFGSPVSAERDDRIRIIDNIHARTDVAGLKTIPDVIVNQMGIGA